MTAADLLCIWSVIFMLAAMVAVYLFGVIWRAYDDRGAEDAPEILGLIIAMPDQTQAILDQTEKCGSCNDSRRRWK
jgi:hypothetical protein